MGEHCFRGNNNNWGHSHQRGNLHQVRFESSKHGQRVEKEVKITQDDNYGEHCFRGNNNNNGRYNHQRGNLHQVKFEIANMRNR